MSKTWNEIKGTIKYILSFICVLTSSIWFDICFPVNIHKIVLQERDATVDSEVGNIEILLEYLCWEYKINWTFRWQSKYVPNCLRIETKIQANDGKQKNFYENQSSDKSQTKDSETSAESLFQTTVFVIFFLFIIYRCCFNYWWLARIFEQQRKFLILFIPLAITVNIEKSFDYTVCVTVEIIILV